MRPTPYQLQAKKMYALTSSLKGPLSYMNTRKTDSESDIYKPVTSGCSFPLMIRGNSESDSGTLSTCDTTVTTKSGTSAGRITWPF